LLSKKSDVSIVVPLDSDSRIIGPTEEIATELVEDMRLLPICEEERKETTKKLHWWDVMAERQGRTAEDLVTEDLIIDSVHDAFKEEGIENPDEEEVAQAVADIMGSLDDEDDEEDEGV
jgi:hypothetical protein